MLNLRFTATFKRDYRQVKVRVKSLAKLEMILEALQRREGLLEAARDHSLSGAYRGHRECHIEPDWLLIYRIDEEGLILIATRTGSHSELLGL
ncbi:MAG: type II toxin-antitoxin system YafQ family toxin [Olsenella sp.]